MSYRIKQDLVDHIHALIERDDWDYVDWIEAMAHVSSTLEQILWDDYINEDRANEIPRQDAR